MYFGSKDPFAARAAFFNGSSAPVSLRPWSRDAVAILVRRMQSLRVCGFVGGTDPRGNLEAATRAIQHRGPDAREVRPGHPIGVGFCRLKIIDLDDAANQPMYSASRGVWVVFNGEIYRFRALRRELESRGHAFRTRSDTEVLLEAYLEWGDHCLDHLDGMFAAAIYDPRENRLKLYRDRPGIKPLYYFYNGRNFAFASELKAIGVLLGDGTLEHDVTALYDFLTYHYIPAPKTLFRNVFKLPPAYRLVYDVTAGQIESVRPYWQLTVPSSPKPRFADEAAEELRALVDDAVHDQMLADVPLGFFLSGGVDSSAVVSAATQRADSIDTFSIGFEPSRDSETHYARLVANALGTRHHESILSPDDTLAMVPCLRQWFDEPFGDTSSFPTYLVSRFARDHVTVVLTGDGGDEVFGGYRRYRRFQRYSRLPSVPNGWTRIVEVARRPLWPGGRAFRILNELDLSLRSEIDLYARLRKSMPARDRAAERRRFGIETDYDDYWCYRKYWRADLPVLTRLQYLDFHTFLPDLVLTKVDRTSMAVSLEVRVPLLDRRVVEFAFGLPESVRYHGGQLKGLLKLAFRDRLPSVILTRRKMGFQTPPHYLQGAISYTSRQQHLLQEFLGQNEDNLPL